MAKFLQDTLEATALKSKKKRSDDALPTQFVEFMKKVFILVFLFRIIDKMKIISI